MSKFLTMDCETGPGSIDRLKSIMPEFEAGANLKDPVKIASAIEAKKSKWLADAALDASTGRVLCIGIMEGDDISILEGADPEDENKTNDGMEAGMLMAFWEAWSKRAGHWVTHNGKSFDFPFLMRRSWILGVKVPGDVMEGRYLSSLILDTMTIWACGTRDMISLDNLGKTLGVGQKNEGGGKHFHMLYAEDRAAALEYLRQDLRLTRDCARKMGVMP